MSGVSAISSSVSFSAPATAAAGTGVDASAASGASPGTGVNAASPTPAGAMSQQIAGLVNMMGDSNQTNALAALALALLLSKSEESKDKNDPWKMLAGLALMNSLGQGQGPQVNITTNISFGADPSAAYAATAPGATAAGSLNVQG